MIGALACGLAFHGQALLRDAATRPRGTGWYATGILLLLLAWKGTDRNRNLLSDDAPERSDAADSGATPENRAERRRAARIRALRYGVAFLAVLLNVGSVVALRRNGYDSLAAGLGWVASLVLLAAAFAGERARGGRREASGHAEVEEGTDLRLPRAAEIAIFLAILALALGLRLYRLGDWSGGMHGDEGEVGMDALRILNGRPVSPFRTGWFGQPNFYYWGVAIGMKLFGTGLAGLRAFSTVAGTLIILPLYLLARQLFGVRTAILACLFLAISDIAIHFSRWEFSNITTPLLLVTGFFLFFRGLRNRRPILFVLAAYAHASCLYFYLGGRLTPIVAAAFIGYLLVLAPLAGLFPRYRSLRAEDPRRPRVEAIVAAMRRELQVVRPSVRCMLLYAVASLAFATPWIGFYWDHRQFLDARARDKIVFSHAAELAKEYKVEHDPLYLGVRVPRPTDVLPLPIAFERTRLSIALAKDGFWPRVLWGQLKRTLSILTYNNDASSVYTFTKEPVTKPIEAVLVVMGIAWALWRWRDTRMALLSIWFWLTILVGGVLTIDAPYMARLVGIIPVLALFAAVVLDKLATELVRVCGAAGGPPRGARFGQAVSSAALLSLAGVLTWQNAADYYGKYLGQRPFAETIGQASFVRDMNAAASREGRPPPKIYDLGAHFIYWGHGVNRFLNRGASGQDVANISEALPILDNEDRDALFMVWNVQQQYLPILRAYYPEAKERQFLYGSPGHELPLFTYYRVNREQIDVRRALQARYVPARGAPIERGEGSLGLSSPGPAGLVYPVRASWKGNLFVPSFGRYRFTLESSGPASFTLDGEPVLASRGGTMPESDVVLARGVHDLSLGGTLPSDVSRLLVRWSAGNSEPTPVPRRFLWSGPGRSLLGEVRRLAGKVQAELGQSLCGANASTVIQRRVDGYFGFRDAPGALWGARRPLMACWTGDLGVVLPGQYQFEVLSNGGSMIFIDGKPVVDNRHGDGLPRSGGGRVALSPGKHRLELQYSWARDPGYLEVYWMPPGGERSMIGPDQLSVKGGLWWPGQLEEPVSLAPELIQDAFVAVQTPAAGARGCAFDRRHHFYVADTERDRVAVLHDSGRVVHSWGRKGKEPGNFLTVEDVSIGPDGMVYVLDSALARVQVFTPDGRLIRAIGEVGCSPAGLAVGPDASVYIASACDDTVRRYAPSGKPLAEYRAGRDPKTQLAQPVDVAVGPGGVLYVADLRDRIVKLDPSSDTIEKSWPVPVGHGSGGANLTLGGRFLYLTDPDHSVLYSIDTSTGRIETLPAESDASPRSGVGPCATARGMAAVVRFPRCLGELLASCRDSRDRDSPR